MEYDQEYLSQAIDEEIALAKLDRNLTGVRPSIIWRDSQVYPKVDRRKPEGRWCGFAPVPLPAYRRDARTAGELAIRRGLNVKHDHDDCSVSAGYGSGRRAVTEFYGAHPDVAAATMAAIARAAIQMLTEQRDEAAALNPARSKSSRLPGARAKTTK